MLECRRVLPMMKPMFNSELFIIFIRLIYNHRSITHYIYVFIYDCRLQIKEFRSTTIYIYITHFYGRYIQYHYHSPSIAAYITSTFLARKSPRAPTCRRRRAARPRKCSGFWPAMLGGKMLGKRVEKKTWKITKIHPLWCM